MKEKLVKSGYDYLMTESYKRIVSGKPYDVNFKPYTGDFIDKLIRFFESEEEYEKCKTLQDFKNIKLNHELGYTINSRS